ncbi:MAG: enoyl-CoA hydratase-related protein, partial [Ilumatobacteraceae bacterium]
METLEVFRQNGVVTVTMSRPAKKNAANATMWQELLDTFRQIADTDSDRVLVLTGAGGDFCSGADLGADGARVAD